VIVGLLLLMLSHGLRRRKLRAWQAVVFLLAFDIAIHFFHHHLYISRIPSAIVACVLLGTLLYFRDDFYAVGDRRTRWLALWVFAGLAAADLAIGLGYQYAGPLNGSYSLAVRVQDVLYEVVGFSAIPTI
jgi:lysyl-tRNA synthetase class 2